MDNLSTTTLLVKKIPGSISNSLKESGDNVKERSEMIKQFIEFNTGQKVIDVRLLTSHRFKNAAFVDFEDTNKASQVLQKLSELEIDGKRLKVEFAKNKSSTSLSNTNHKSDKIETIESSDVCMQNLPNVFDYPYASGLRYRYPKATKQIVDKISLHLMNNKKFYINVCHLMNLMNLEPPFIKVDKEFVNVMKTYNDKDLSEAVDSKSKNKRKRANHLNEDLKDSLLCTDESELESSQ